MRKSGFHWFYTLLCLLALLLLFGLVCASAEESNTISNEEFIKQYGFPETIQVHETQFAADVSNIEVLDANFALQSAVAIDSGKTVAFNGKYRLSNNITAGIDISITFREMILEIDSYVPFHIKEFYLSVDSDYLFSLSLNAEKEMSGEITSEDGKTVLDKELVRVPVFTASGLVLYCTVSAKLDAAGNLELTLSYTDTNFKISYQDEKWNGARTNGTPSVQVNVGGTLGADLGLNFAVGLAAVNKYDLIKVSAILRAETSLSKAYDPDVPKSLLCSDVELIASMYMQAQAGLLPRGENKFKFSYALSWQSPRAALFEKNFHFEGMKPVPECTCRITCINVYLEEGVLYDMLMKAPGSVLTADELPKLTKTGKTLSGWQVTDTTGEMVSEALPVSVGDTELNCTAQWMDENSETFTLPAEFETDFVENLTAPYYYNGTGSPSTIYVLGGEMNGTTLRCSIPDDSMYEDRDKIHVAIEKAGTQVKSIVFGPGFMSFNGAVYCYSLESLYFDDSMSYTGYNNNNPRLTHVHLPANINHSPYFANCYSLQQINLPGGIPKIQEKAFYACRSLSDVALPEGISSIDASAFWGCRSLTHIDIPDSVTEIGWNAFSECTSLRTVRFPSGLSKLSSGVLYNTQLETLDLHVTGDLTIEYQGASCLRSINISGKNITLSGKAFSDSTALQSLTITGDTIRITGDMFRNFPYLTTVSLSANEIYLEDSLFENCLQLRNLTISDCSALYLGSHVFSGCTSLAHFDYTGDVYALSSNATLNSPFSETAIDRLSLRLNVAGLTIRNMPCLTELTLTGSIGTLTVSNDDALTALHLPSNLQEIAAICENTALETLTIPENVTLAENALSENPLLQTVYLPESLTTLPTYLFKNCTSLRSVRFSSRLERINHGAFYGCAQLTELRLPDTLQRVDDIAFANCVSLTELTIPASVTVFGSGALDGCTNLKTVYVQSAEAFVFFSHDFLSDNVIYCPKDSATWSVTEYTRAASDAPVYTLRLHWNDGRADTVKLRTAGDTLYAPSLPTLNLRDEDHLCWFSNPDCTQQAAFPETMPSGDLDLYLGYAYQTTTSDYVDWNRLEGNYDWDEIDPATGNWRKVPKLISYNAEQEFFHIPDQFEIMYANAIHQGVRYVKIGASMRNIDPAAFDSAVDLEYIDVDPANTCYYARNGVLYSVDGTLVIYPCKRPGMEFSIPEGVRAIAQNAFSLPEGVESELLSLYLPDSVNRIAAGAFSGRAQPFAVYTNNTAISSAVAQEGVYCNPTVLALVSDGELLDMYIVSAGLPLPELKTPERDGLQFAGWRLEDDDTLLDLNGVTVPSGGLILCAEWRTALTWELMLPGSLRVIESEAFEGNAMVSVHCPEGTVEIQSRAFADCEQLRDIYLPASVQRIAEDAFSGTENLTIHTTEGSTAAAWAQMHGYAIQIEPMTM